MVQSATFDNRSKKIRPGNFQKEYLYSDHAKWKHDFIPKPIGDKRELSIQGVIFVLQILRSNKETL
ncbi:hypothetical protein Ct9H90mP12_0920 [bacterium]|nr:MAG: hypothetical protein Ct9H90mP12_0920 [bacterium]